jgi:hypothetical protein
VPAAGISFQGGGQQVLDYVRRRCLLTSLRMTTKTRASGIHNYKAWAGIHE